MARNRILIAGLIIALPGATYAQSTRYVDDDAPLGGDGLTWGTALADIDSALVAAEGDPGIAEIRIAGGTYRPSVQATPGVARTETFRLRSELAIRGGYRGLSGSGDPNDRDVSAFPTVLSGDIGVASDNADNCYHVVYSNGTDASAVLEGVIVTAGNASGSAYGEQWGGGMLSTNGSPTVIDCTFYNNTAHVGGGMHLFRGHPTLINCTFQGNTAAGSGGGIFSNYCDGVVLTGCTFLANSALQGGGIANLHDSPALANCMFDGNSAGWGGGMYNHWGVDVALVNCTFTGNNATSLGGGMLNFYGNRMALANCEFSGNNAVDLGGGMCNRASDDVTMINCAYVGNSAFLGGGVGNSNTAGTTLTNCTLAANQAAQDGGGVWNYDGDDMTVANCILWNNAAATGPQIYRVSPNVTVSYSCIQGGWTGEGNIDQDPQFADADGPDDDPRTLVDNDYRLVAGSPCVDAGDNMRVPADSLDLDDDSDSTEPVPFDLDGRTRFLNDLDTPDTGPGVPPIVDMGAYERATDCNGNGVDDALDIDDGDPDGDGAVSGDCNNNAVPDECDTLLPGDLNYDGDVNSDDYPLMITCFSGPQCERSSCPRPVYADNCCLSADTDRDGDVDLFDFARVQGTVWPSP